MIVESKALQPAGRSEEKRKDNGFEKLRPYLAPAVLNVPRLENAWLKLDRKLVTFLYNMVAKKNHPWLNHLYLLAIIYNESGATDLLTKVGTLDRFLRWAIPKHYPNMISLDPAEALIDYFGDPPAPRGLTTFHTYSSQQLHVQDYLSSFQQTSARDWTSFSPCFLVHLS